MTIALVAVNVAVFALETWWGGSEFTPTLHRMGANLGGQTLPGEPWRVLSSALLHIGPVHLAANMWALFVLGSLLERLLGSARFLVLYAFSAAGGGLLSAAIGRDTVAAGASGAVWGLLVAQLVIVLRPQGLLPPWIRVNRKAAVQPLVINGLISMAPGIDLWAHLGGGLAGGALLATRVVVPPLEPERRFAHQKAWNALALAAAGALFTCLGLAWWHGRPWELRQPPAGVAREVAGTPVRLRLPASLQARAPESDEDGHHQAFGDLSADPIALDVYVTAFPDLVGEPERREAAASALEQLVKLGPGDAMAYDVPPQHIDLPAGPGAQQSSRWPKGGRLHRTLVYAPGWRIDVQTAIRPNASARWTKLAEEIPQTLELSR